MFGAGDRSMGVSGTFDEVAVPTRLVSTEQFDDFPGPSTNTLLLAPAGDDRTAMTLTVVYPDRETRDGWVASGMTEGLGAGYDRLDEILTPTNLSDRSPRRGEHEPTRRRRPSPTSWRRVPVRCTARRT